jgi:ubiquinone/menaquinone biosynthesis C-methylase UbiE
MPPGPRLPTPDATGRLAVSSSRRLTSRFIPFSSSRLDTEELLDQSGHDPAELAANLRDIRRVNRLAGGTATILRYLPRLADAVPRDRPLDVLDLATGSGDIPHALARWARRDRRPLQLTVIDRSPDILAEARRTLADVPDVTFVTGDARDVALPDRACDVVLCSLTLHHFAPPDAIAVLREMERLCRAGFIVNDIRRCLPGYLTAWVVSRVATRNRLTRHDMPLSVRRAYTSRELRTLLREAGIGGATVTTHPLFRMAAVRQKTDMA